MLGFGKVAPDVILAAVWPDVSTILQERGVAWLEENDLTDRDVFMNLLTEVWELWLATEDTILKGVVVTGMREDELRILWAGGEKLENYMFLALCMLERYALANGVDNVTLGGRKGWGKLLAPLHYLPNADGYGKSLTAAYMH